MKCVNIALMISVRSRVAMAWICASLLLCGDLKVEAQVEVDSVRYTIATKYARAVLIEEVAYSLQRQLEGKYRIDIECSDESALSCVESNSSVAVAYDTSFSHNNNTIALYSFSRFTSSTTMSVWKIGVDDNGKVYKLYGFDDDDIVPALEYIYRFPDSTQLVSSAMFFGYVSGHPRVIQGVIWNQALSDSGEDESTDTYPPVVFRNDFGRLSVRFYSGVTGKMGVELFVSEFHSGFPEAPAFFTIKISR